MDFFIRFLFLVSVFKTFSADLMEVESTKKHYLYGHEIQNIIRTETNDTITYAMTISAPNHYMQFCKEGRKLTFQEWKRTHSQEDLQIEDNVIVHDIKQKYPTITFNDHEKHITRTIERNTNRPFAYDTILLNVLRNYKHIVCTYAKYFCPLPEEPELDPDLQQTSPNKRQKLQ